MTDFNTIELQKDPRGFATLWLNRADKNNAFNAEMIRELILALDAVMADKTTPAASRELAELMHNLYQLKIPTLAVVQGAAFGGALGLISCCDMAIGTHDAQLCLSEVRIGLAPAVISPFVVQAIGERAARRYALTAERFSGQRAQ